MEAVKNIIKQFYPLLMMLCGFSFVVTVFLSDEKNVFVQSGEVYEPMRNDGATKNEGFGYMEGAQIPGVPNIKYAKGTQVKGQQVRFKECFAVTKTDETAVGGNQEDDFAIYLIDITDADEKSVLKFMTADEIQNSGEVTASFVYDKENDMLFFHKEGIYNVRVKIYGKNGGQKTYDFLLPVEPR